MKHVWILNHYAQEPGRAGGTRHYSLAKYLLNYGWQANIIAASVELNTGYQRLKKGEVFRLDHYDGIPFLWIKTPEYTGNGLRRMINMLTYTFRAHRLFFTRVLPHPDVIIGSSVHPFAAWVGMILARRHRVPFIFEVRDLWPQTLIDLGHISRNSLASVFLRNLERLLYTVADRILVLLPRADRYITSIGISANKIIWLPNGVDITNFSSMSSDLGESEHFTIMYFGAHGNANGLDNLIQTMALMKQRNLPQPIRLRLIGDGPSKTALVRKAIQLELDNVFFEPPVPKNTIPAIAKEADAFVFNLVDAPVFKYGISSNKLFDYMASNRPIIFCSNSVNNPIREANAGITVAPEDPSALADAIEKLLYMTFEERFEMGKNGRHFVEKNHDYSILAKRLSAVLDDIYFEYSMRKVE